MSWLSSFLHPSRGYEAAGQQYQDYFNQAQGQLQPYAQQGQDMYSQLSPAIASMLNPEQQYAQWMQGYEESPYAKQMQERAMNQGLQAASSMGMLGSTPALRAMQEGASMISNADRENYLNRLMNMYTQGATQAQNIYGQGAGMASQMGNQMINQGERMGDLAQTRQAAGGQALGNIGNTLLAAWLGAQNKGNNVLSGLMGGVK